MTQYPNRIVLVLSFGLCGFLATPSIAEPTGLGPRPPSQLRREQRIAASANLLGYRRDKVQRLYTAALREFHLSVDKDTPIENMRVHVVANMRLDLAYRAAKRKLEAATARHVRLQLGEPRTD